jgi:hypothetical protein
MSDIALPTLDAYNGAVQNPRTAFSDPVLQQGQVLTTGLGLPQPFSGGFALSYKFICGPRNYAVRVFHKKSDRLQDRYNLIAGALQRLKSPYFIDFVYQPRGITMTGHTFPVVRMDWVEGETLGSYLDLNFSDGVKINSLRSEFQKVGRMLAEGGIAHGDLQTGNVMIGPGSFKLIDYDGMWINGMTENRSPELGHRHFQHPGRTETTFNRDIDRFSLILIDFSLEVLQARPALFRKYGGSGENILFTATDYRDPGSSPLFQDLSNDSVFKAKAGRFAALCKSPFSLIPTPEDFASGKWTSSISITFEPGRPTPQEAVYVGAYDVCDATNYNGVLRQVGNRIELIGQIVEVKEGLARNRRPYVFINFGNWQGSIVKIAIWSSALNSLSPRPSASWKGKWVSVTGLVDPPYTNKKYHYTHLSITITAGNQITIIDERTAKFRLRGGSGPSTKGGSKNAEVLAKLRPESVAAPTTTPKSSNQQVLDALKRSGSRGSSTNLPPTQQYHSPAQQKDNGLWGCLGYIAVFVVIAILLHSCSTH